MRGESAGKERGMREARVGQERKTFFRVALRAAQAGGGTSSKTKQPEYGRPEYAHVRPALGKLLSHV